MSKLERLQLMQKIQNVIFAMGVVAMVIIMTMIGVTGGKLGNIFAMVYVIAAIIMILSALTHILSDLPRKIREAKLGDPRECLRDYVCGDTMAEILQTMVNMDKSYWFWNYRYSKYKEYKDK